MIKLLISIALLNLLAAMTPGPDFALITRNTVQYSRRAGILTALGISTAVLVHITYCSLGLAIIITKSTVLFDLIKFAGGSYLIYMGISAIKSQKKANKLESNKLNKTPLAMGKWQAFRQGFLTNLLNPKAAIFFLALFTMVVDTGLHWFTLALALTLFITVFAWFSCLTLILSHQKVAKLLQRSQKIIIKATGIFLIVFGLALFFAQIKY